MDNILLALGTEQRDRFQGTDNPYTCSVHAGPFGGVRAAMQLRCLLGELGCIAIPDIFAIPAVHEALDEEGKPNNDRLTIEAQQFIGQLDWHARAMKTHREAHGVPGRRDNEALKQ